MKKIFLITVCLLTSYWVYSSNASLASRGSSTETITIISSPDLFYLTQNWVDEYSKLNPGMNFKLLKLEDFNFNEGSANDAILYFISSEYDKSIGKGPFWKMVVGTDAIVPIINTKNPYYEKIYSHGITSEQIAKLLANPGQQVWGSLFNDGGNDLICLYQVDNEFITKEIENYLNINAPVYPTVKLNSFPELIAKIQKDRNAIGFCKLYNAIDQKTQNLVDNIKLLPIDINGNGKLDNNEKIYENLSDFMRGIMIGKYPRAFCGNLYLFSPQKPSNENEIKFISWILTEGQKFLTTNGFADLAYNQRKSGIDRLVEAPVVVKSTSTSYIIPLVALLVGIVVGLFFITDYLIQKFRTARPLANNAPKVSPSVFNENSIVIPQGLYFDKTHTWSFMKKNGVVEIGIDDFLQHVTGPITRLKMKNPGDRIKKGELLLSIIQDGKQININSPITGIIKEHNTRLQSDTSLFNNSPYYDGWIYTVEPTNWLRETQFMDMADKYRGWILSEFSRLKEFLTNSLMTNNLEYAGVVLQDGGEIKDHILKNFGPEVWDDFQTKFIDTAR